jgi:hypothetical protein
MPIQQKARYRLLTNLLDTSFGKSSERQYPNHFIKMTMPLENTILVKSQILVNLGGTQNAYITMRPKFREELLEMIQKRLERISDEYKRAAEAATDESMLSYRKQPYEEAPVKTVKLSVDNHTIQEWLEHVSMSAYRTNKTCIYHLHCLVTVA